MIGPDSPGLRLQIPNPSVDEDVVSEDNAEKEYQDMPTATPIAASARVTTAPALPQPPRFEGRTMEDRWDFIHQYEAFMTSINALQTRWGGGSAMPVGACVETRTKRMLARYVFRCQPHEVMERQ